MTRDPYKYFRVEARELVDGLAAGALELERGGAEPALVARLLRLAHTLKGAARVVRQPGVADLAHAMEDVLSRHRDGAEPLVAGSAARLLGMIDAVSAQLAGLGAPPPTGEATHPPAGPMAAPPREPAPRPAAAAPAAATAAPTLVAAPRAGQVEERIDAVRVDAADLDRLLDAVAEAETQLSAVEAAAGGDDRARAADPGRGGIGAADAAAGAQRLARSQRREDAVRRCRRELIAARDIVERVRLVAASTLFPALARAARDAADSLGKQVDFATAGGDVRLDAHVMAAVGHPLMHLVRNGVAHGIEGADERRALGKAPRGRVEVTVERHRERARFACRDDGRGIDLEAVRRVAVERRLVTAAEAQGLDLDGAFRLLLRGGVTTAGGLSGIAGRGVGLDVVREAAGRLDGEVAVRSEPGRGTAVELDVPASLSAFAALTVEAGGTAASIPLDRVRAAVRVTPAELCSAGDGAQALVLDGASVPFAPLAPLLGRPAASGRGVRAWSAVVLAAGGRLAALGVDRLLGVRSVVMKPLPALAGRAPLALGAWLDPEGSPVLVLDAAGVVAAASAGAPEAPPPPPAPPPVLVIDDSPTTRMLERGILEAAGYEVDLAASAEEALERVRTRRYGLFLVDVEMPGMSGFEFVARARDDPALARIPSILVTSRGSDADRRRGAEAGARAYIVKGDFDEGRLLEAIRGLIG